jgi:TRAP-type C4-dicarboxylate transport system permease small subunit
MECALVCLFIVIIVCVSLQVFFRYVLNSPLIWSEETARLCFLWMIFLGLALAEKDDLHIAVEFFVGKMPNNVQKPLRIAVEIFGIIVLLVICYYAVNYIAIQKAMRSVALNISMMYFTTAIPVGCFLYSIYKLFTINRLWHTKDFTPSINVPQKPE